MYFNLYFKLQNVNIFQFSLKKKYISIYITNLQYKHKQFNLRLPLIYVFLQL